MQPVHRSCDQKCAVQLAMAGARQAALGLSLGLALIGLPGGALAQATTDTLAFNMSRSTAAVTARCLAGARARVFVHSLGPVEQMTVLAQGLPPDTEFDLFVIQLPDAPFGLSWYQGDLETNAQGLGVGVFVGRFSEETFIVAPGSGDAPEIHPEDATTNPATDPVHTLHLGLWFNSPDDASAAGCPNTVTPFNGDHTAGIQALSTRRFPPDQGPLGQLGSQPPAAQP